MSVPEIAPSTAPEVSAAPEARPRRRPGAAVLVAVAAVLIIVGAVLVSPFWAPEVMRALPWGRTAAAKPPATAAELAALKAEAGRGAAAVQQLSQRITALEARPAPDLSPIQQQLAALQAKSTPDLSGVQQKLAALDKTTADLGDKVAAIGKAERQQAAADPKAAMALVLLQIREAVDVGRPFGAEYQALVLLAHDQPDIAAAAQPLAGPAQTGVASRAALIERLRQLAPQIATAHPPPTDTLKSRVVARLRSLVTIRRIDGDNQTPAEAAVSTAQDDVAKGDLAGAVAGLDKLDGPSKAAAEPWIKMAKARLAAETALRQVEMVLTTSLGGPAPVSGGQGG